MDATDTHSEYFSVLQAAKEGFKVIGKKPLRLLGMAIAVNVPHLLYGLFVRGVLLPGQPLWGSGLPGFTSLSMLIKPANIVALTVLLITLLLLRPIWIRMCLRLCSADSPRPNSRIYLNFALANILQFVAVFLVALIAGA